MNVLLLQADFKRSAIFSCYFSCESLRSMQTFKVKLGEAAMSSIPSLLGRSIGTIQVADDEVEFREHEEKLLAIKRVGD